MLKGDFKLRSVPSGTLLRGAIHWLRFIVFGLFTDSI
jgi:hypothetical protein